MKSQLQAVKSIALEHKAPVEGIVLTVYTPSGRAHCNFPYGTLGVVNFNT